MKWTQNEIDFLIENTGKLTISEISEKLSRSFYAIKTKALRLGILNKNHYWSEEDTEWLKENYPSLTISQLSDKLKRSEKSIYTQAHILGLKKDREIIRQRLIKNISDSFIKNQYKKGCTPVNKGVPMSAEKYEKCKHTMFKKGHKVHNENPDGDGAITLRNNKGWICYYIRVSKGKWIPLHRYIWEQVNGSIPKNNIVTFKNGDYHDCRIENLELLSRSDNMKRNSFRNYPKDVVDLMYIKTGFNRKLNNIIKDYGEKN